MTDEIARRAWLSGARVLAVRDREIPGHGVDREIPGHGVVAAILHPPV